MRFIRFAISLLILNNFAFPALAAPACLQPGDSQAFNIVGLKSTLMVAALSCGLSKDYDIFMTRFQPQVQEAQKGMDGFFMRQGGLAGQVLEDDFTTLLANNESDAAVHAGSAFCAQAAKRFAKVAALAGSMDFIAYAGTLKLAVAPGSPVKCPAAPPVMVASTAPPAARPEPKLVKAKHPAPRFAAVAKPLGTPKAAAAPKPVPAPQEASAAAPAPFMVAQTI